MLLHYGIERFLYRLSVSDHHEKFVLKGGLFFVLHEIPARRFTRDIDLSGHTEYSEDEIEAVIAEICTLEIPSDGIVFDPAAIEVQMIHAPINQGGVRITFLGQLGSARIHMQLDLGFRDEFFPNPKQMTYPSLLDMQPPVILACPPEAVISEKFQAMIFLGEVNSRMKDFYDI